MLLCERCYENCILKLPNGKIICVPKTTIQSEFSRDITLLQDIIIDDWILRKFGLII